MGLPMTVPCGQCIGCRLERSRQWAVRIMHEASMREDNAFVTLTLDDRHLPADGSLSVRTHQLFLKRLRKRIGVPIRFFLCGEYGEKNGRPHYHACIFGYRFPDRVRWTVRNGHTVWRSEELESVWPYGQSEIGSLTFESAAYVARYCTKKVTGRGALDHYAGRVPEYAAMSRRPGIGAGWIERFYSDVYPSDEVIVREKSCKPPRYYDQYMEGREPETATRVRRLRSEARRLSEETPERLAVREVCAQARLSTFKREVER